MKDVVVGGLLAAGVLMALFTVSTEAVDASIDAQNEMLCVSAKTSGNTEYIKKCSEFYIHGNIEYMRGL